MQWTWEFGDDLDRYMHKAGLQTYAQLSRECGVDPGVDPAEISRLRLGYRLSGKKVCHRLPHRLICIIRVFIRKEAITSTEVVEEWLNKIPLGCLDGEGYEQIIQEAKKELETMRAKWNQAKVTSDAIAPSSGEMRQAYKYDDVKEESTDALEARRNALLEELAQIDKQLYGKE